MAWGENAVILSENGIQVTYRRKCPNCGKVDTQISALTTILTSTTHLNTTCPYCKTNYNLVLHKN